MASDVTSIDPLVMFALGMLVDLKGVGFQRNDSFRSPAYRR
jgi:hypothetical protein